MTTEWFETQSGLWTRLWQTLTQGVSDPAAAAHWPVMATVSAEGWPEARTVVLRGADETLLRISVHTDLFSDKIASLRANGRAAFHVWDAGQALQIRLQCDVEIQSGATTRALWDSIPDHAQQSYGVTPPPGTPIADALSYQKKPDPASFAVLYCTVQQIDLVHLGRQHRRVAFSRQRHWQGQWLSP